MIYLNAKDLTCGQYVIVSGKYYCAGRDAGDWKNPFLVISVEEKGDIVKVELYDYDKLERIFFNFSPDDSRKIYPCDMIKARQYISSVISKHKKKIIDLEDKINEEKTHIERYEKAMSYLN